MGNVGDPLKTVSCLTLLFCVLLAVGILGFIKPSRTKGVRSA